MIRLLALALLVAGCKEKLPVADNSSCVAIEDTYKRVQACSKLDDAQRKQSADSMKQVAIMNQMAIDHANKDDAQATANVAANTCKATNGQLLELLTKAGC